MVELTGVRFAYDHSPAPLLDIARLTLAPGEKAMVRGPSGSGKSTLLSLLSGSLRAQAGTITVNGQNVSAMSDAEARAFRINEIGFIFQDFALIEYLNVVENILLPYRINPALKLDAAVRARARKELETLGIAHKAASYPARLSFGERQRVAIARAMATGSKLILADEPTANLDADNAARTVEMLLNSASANHAAVLMVSHDPAMARYFERIIEMRELR
jgi:putative ABC transport system ATP-binding protein